MDFGSITSRAEFFKEVRCNQKFVQIIDLKDYNKFFCWRAVFINIDDMSRWGDSGAVASGGVLDNQRRFRALPWA
jgi:hypothetical protein